MLDGVTILTTRHARDRWRERVGTGPTHARLVTAVRAAAPDSYLDAVRLLLRVSHHHPVAGDLRFAVRWESPARLVVITVIARESAEATEAVA